MINLWQDAIKKAHITLSLLKLVGRARIELATNGLRVHCSTS